MKIIIAFFLVVISAFSNAALIDNTTYTTDTATGYDWLDLSATTGLSVSTALATYSGDGYQYANDNQVQGLLSAFGIPWVFSVGTVTPLTTTVAQETLFTSYLGATYNSDGALGGFELSGLGRSGYLCISVSSCGAGSSFTRDADLSGGNPIVGQFLVRTSGAESVPEPATLALFGLGFAGLGWSRRKKA